MGLLDTAGGAGAASIGGSLIAQSINSSLTNYANYQNDKKQRAWAEKMYGVQRKDALADWQMQADYNSPHAQMERLKAAGLNPNLVYGNGATAEMGTPVRSSSTGSYSPKVSEQNLAPNNPFGEFQNANLQQITTDNAKKQGILLDQQAKNLAAMEFKIYSDVNKNVATTQGLDIKNSYAPQIAEMSLQGMEAAIGKTTAETDYTKVKTAVALDANERAELKQGMDFKVAAQKILTMRAQRIRMSIQNLETQAKTTESIANSRKILAQKDLLLDQQILTEKQMDNLDQIIRQNSRKADLLDQQPNWVEQKAINTLTNFLESLTGKGTMFNPTQRNVDFQRVRIENQRGTWK